MNEKEQDRRAYKHFFILSFLFLFWSSKKEKPHPPKEEMINLNIFSILRVMQTTVATYDNTTPALSYGGGTVVDYYGVDNDNYVAGDVLNSYPIPK